MTLKKNPKISPGKDKLLERANVPDHFLTLHNDNINTFEFVINALVEICKHDMVQAEQCAYLTHYKGQCDIKKGSRSLLKSMRDELIVRGLTATIE